MSTTDNAPAPGPGGRGRLAQVIATRGGKAAPEAPFVIEHREALIYMLCQAAELEHAIMCQYLFAAFSLKTEPGEGLSGEELEAARRWRQQVMHVAVQEMLHLALVHNLLSAVGAAPHMARPNLPEPADHYPAGVVLALLPFGKQALEHFMFLERPEGMDLADAEGLEACGRARPLIGDGDIVPQLQDFATIGHMYRSIEAGIAHLAQTRGEDWLFIGPPRAQATPAHFHWPELVAVTDLATAQQAIDTILEQGEGPRGDWRDAHFGQFVRILDDFEDRTEADPAFAPVRPVLAANVRAHERDADVPLITDPLTARVADLFNVAYEVLLNMFERFFAHTTETDSQLKTLADTTIALMVRVIGPLGGVVTTLPAGPEYPGRTAGPSFELFYESDFLMPHREAAWSMLSERLDEAARLCEEIQEECGAALGGQLEPARAALAELARTLAGGLPAHLSHARRGPLPEVPSEADLAAQRTTGHDLAARIAAVSRTAPAAAPLSSRDPGATRDQASGLATAELAAVFAAALGVLELATGPQPLAPLPGDPGPGAALRGALAARLTASVLRPLADDLAALAPEAVTAPGSSALEPSAHEPSAPAAAAPPAVSQPAASSAPADPATAAPPASPAPSAPPAPPASPGAVAPAAPAPGGTADVTLASAVSSVTDAAPASSGRPDEAVWEVAQSGTAALIRLAAYGPPPPGLAEAVAALQDLAVQLAPVPQRAARLAALRELSAGLRPGIRVATDGPYLVTGCPRLVNHLGEQITAPPQLALCRCGRSALKPFCDGSHAGSGFSGAKDPKRVPDQRDTYEGQELTVYDNRGICQHSGLCTDRLATAFRASQEPFVAPSGGRMDEIIRAVRDCPSGALSYAVDDRERRAHVDWAGTREPAVEITRDGPYRVTGGLSLTHPDGADVPRAAGSSREHFALCRCGQSQNKPFCSGMHWHIGFTDPVPEPGAEPTLFEWAGGLPALTRLTRLLHEKHIPADPLVAPLFADLRPGQAVAEARWLGQVFGGPAYRGPELDGFPAPTGGQVMTGEQQARWVQLATVAADGAGLPADPEFRAALSSFLEWSSRRAVTASPGRTAPPDGAAGRLVPRWTWGPAGPPDTTPARAANPADEVSLPGPSEPVSFEAHIKPLFRASDRKSMSFVFDLWSHDDVAAHAAAILTRLQDGSMPCDGAWPAAWIEVFQRWAESGTRP